MKKQYSLFINTIDNSLVIVSQELVNKFITELSKMGDDPILVAKGNLKPISDLAESYGKMLKRIHNKLVPMKFEVSLN